MQHHTVTVSNYAQAQFELTFEACVDDRFQLITMPMSWKDGFGKFEQEVEQSWCEDLHVVRAGPARFQIEGRKIHFSEIDFVQNLGNTCIGRIAATQSFDAHKIGGKL
jgi:hypothetical protein